MTVFDNPAFDDHEHVSFFCDPAAGLRAVIAVHRTVMGGAGGGCRMHPYATSEEALTDALRLSKAMTYKLALADLPAGGAKAVLIGDPAHDKTPALFQALGRAVERLGGRYILAEDVGVGPEDVAHVRETTAYALTGARPTAAATARGVYLGMRVAAELRFGRSDLRGRTVAVQGLGGVGGGLTRALARDGARLLVHDVDPARVEWAVRELGAQTLRGEELLCAECDVLAPCALGGVLTAANVPRLRCRMVAGGANNQLAKDDLAEQLAAHDILYVPDFVLNAGGVIAAALYATGRGETNDEVDGALRAVADMTREVLRRAAAAGVTPQRAAVAWAKEKLAA